MADPRFYDNRGPFTLAEICSTAGATLPQDVDGALARYDRRISLAIAIEFLRRTSSSAPSPRSRHCLKVAESTEWNNLIMDGNFRAVARNRRTKLRQHNNLQC